MEASQNTKNTDCYFYYYSTCSRENCAYRHEPSSRGCEVTCQQWKEGKCTNQHCSLRHMEIKKKRSEISCYWENQPSGCLKAHCPFMHQNKVNTGQGAAPAPIANKEAEAAIASHEIPPWNVRSNHESLPGTATAPEAVRRLSQTGSESYASPPVEPVIVTFEEESDSESTKSWTPRKVSSKESNFGVKTLEEIRLDEIHAEQAAYWQNVAEVPIIWEDTPENSQISDRFVSRKVQNSGVVKLPKLSEELDFKVLSLEEIRRNRHLKKQEEEGVVSSSPTNASRPSVLNRLGYSDDTPRNRRVSSTTDNRKAFKRVHSPDFVEHRLKKMNVDLLDDTEEFLTDQDVSGSAL